MSHLDLYLDKCPGFGWEGNPSFNTLIVPLQNKRTSRNAEWSQPGWTFGLPFNNNFPDAYRQIMDMFLLCRGRLHAFRVRNQLFFDAQDWKFGVGDGVEDEFQLGRLIEGDGESFLHEIHALSLESDAPTLVVTVNGTPAAATFNDRTGKVVFDTPPANDAELRWTGYFDFWVRFAVDDLPATIDNKSSGEFVTNYLASLEETEAPDEGFST